MDCPVALLLPVTNSGHRDCHDLSLRAQRANPYYPELMANPNISFVVSLFNHLAQTQAMLATLAASMPARLSYEVILVDDFSTDGTLPGWRL